MGNHASPRSGFARAWKRKWRMSASNNEVEYRGVSEKIQCTFGHSTALPRSGGSAIACGHNGVGHDSCRRRPDSLRVRLCPKLRPSRSRPGLCADAAQSRREYVVTSEVLLLVPSGQLVHLRRNLPRPLRSTDQCELVRKVPSMSNIIVRLMCRSWLSDDDASGYVQDRLFVYQMIPSLRKMASERMMPRRMTRT